MRRHRRHRLPRRYLGRIGHYEIEAVRHSKTHRKKHHRRHRYYTSIF